MQETQEMWVQSLGREDPLEEGTATHSRILAWRIPGTEEPGGLQSTGSQRVRHNWSNWTQLCAGDTKICKAGWGLEQLQTYRLKVSNEAEHLSGIRWLECSGHSERGVLPWWRGSSIWPRSWRTDKRHTWDVHACMGKCTRVSGGGDLKQEEQTEQRQGAQEPRQRVGKRGAKLNGSREGNRRGWKGSVQAHGWEPGMAEFGLHSH